MKKALTQLYAFFAYIFKFWRNVKLRGYQKRLREAAVQQKVDRIIAKDIIVKDIRKALKIDSNSDYIPFDVKNREEIRTMIETRHGGIMRQLNIKLTHDLKLV